MSPGAILDLLQLADSALPIGAQSHSFGLEGLVTAGDVDVHNLGRFLVDYIYEITTIECVYLRAAYALGTQSDRWDGDAWLDLNRKQAALRTAWETREAGMVLGRRFLSLFVDIYGSTVAQAALDACRRAGVGCQHPAAFGLAGGLLALGVEPMVLAYCQQSTAALLAAAQKLLPIGQNAVMRMRRQLKDALVATANESRSHYDARRWAWGFAPMVELASMRHPYQPVRLFIS